MRARRSARNRSAVALLMLAVPSGCGLRITPPVEPHEPTRVVLADYGAHLSLVLPRSERGCVEYAYGWWDWFALNRDRWYHALPLLIAPGRGTLGRRELRGEASVENVRAQTGVHAVHELSVAERPVAALVAQLDREFEAGRGEELYNPKIELHMAPNPRLYWLHDNCNSAVARWLRQLGARVDGLALLAEVELRDAPQSAASP